MPYVNLLVAQGMAAWVAAPDLVALVVSQNDAGLGPYYFYFIAALGALIVWIGGHIGSRVSKTIHRPTLLTLGFALVFALIGAYLAAVFFAPHVEEQRIMGELFMITPVAAALLGYMLHRGAHSA
jgi:hypothetical protein